MDWLWDLPYVDVPEDQICTNPNWLWNFLYPKIEDCSNPEIEGWTKIIFVPVLFILSAVITGWHTFLVVIFLKKLH